MPNFLGIGAMKSGTTWIAEILSAHPEIFVAHGKELHYFSHKYSEGIEWYLNHFRTVHKEKAVGEYSPSYMMESQVVSQRIYEFNPKMKLIVTVRNPMERAFSVYRWLIQRGEKLSSLHDAIEKWPGIVLDGLYFQKLKPYWDLFSDDQIHIVLYEDIENNAIKVQRDLYQFLEVDKEFNSNLADTVVGKTISPRIQTVEIIRSHIHTWTKQHNVAFIITWAKKIGISQLYRRFNDKSEQDSMLTSEDRKKIYPYFAEDIKKFRDKTGLGISFWCEEYR